MCNGKTKQKKAVIKGKIISNIKVAEDHYRMKIEAPRLGRASSPGQFVSVRVRDDTTDPLLRIPLGVHGIDGKGISLLYKVVGDGTDILSAKKAGEKIDVLGPLGNGFDLTLSARGKNPEAIIVAGGHGIAPLCALAEELIKKRRKVRFFIGAGTKKHVVCAKELRKMGVKVHVATEDGTMGVKGYVTALVEEHLKRVPGPGLRDTVIYACGPRPMVAALAKDAKRRGMPAQVSFDAYMACGIGACLGCAVRTRDGYKLVCTDGPVFDAEEIDWKAEG